MKWFRFVTVNGFKVFFSNDLSWRRHQMETFSALLVICAVNSPVPGEFPAQRPVTLSFDVFFICVWINGWVNIREAGDLRRYRSHYDVIVMSSWRGGCQLYTPFCDKKEVIRISQPISIFIIRSMNHTLFAPLLLRGKYYQKINIPIFRIVLQNFGLPGCFPYILFYL